MKEENTSRGMGNPLGWEDINKLIISFAIPAIVSGLVAAIYNIVDQIFIGRYVGIYGNAATNVAFPITTISTSVALLLGIGGSSNFSLFLGRGEEDRARRLVGNAISLMGLIGLGLMLIISIFLGPLLRIFGATESVMPYAMDYTRLVALGLPFFILSTAGSFLIRADGSPNYAMFSNVIGAVLNVILDYIFIVKFSMGMKGAALATIIGQFVSALMVGRYLMNFRTIQLSRDDFKIRWMNFKKIAALGASGGFNQLALTVFQIVMNNTLSYYGGLSKYGSEIPLAAVGVISKVNVIFISVVVGVAQGSQPIFGYNYGAENYDRVKETYRKALIVNTSFAILTFIAFQLFPREIISLFGSGDELYYEFAVKYFKIYMMMIFLNGIQPLTGNFFSAIGKARVGIFVSMTRQILFLVPLIIIFPKFLGIDGVLYAGPISDTVSAIVALTFVRREMKNMDEMSRLKGV